MSKEKKENKKVPYGLSHTKFYTKSIVADFLVERDKESNRMCVNSDINLLLRQKTLHRTIGIDQLRHYVEGLEQKEPQRHDFTDDELFQLIEPKEVNNLTTAYEYAQYLQKNSDKLKENYKKLKKEKEDYEKFLQRITPKDK